MRRAALLAAALTSLALTPASAAQYSVSVFPAHGEKATPEEWSQAYTLATRTPGLSAYFFAATWGELVDSDHNRFEEFRTIAQAGQAAKLPGYLGIQVINTAVRALPNDLQKKRWTKPELLLRFDETAQKLSAVAATDIKWISIGNEADVYLADHDDEVEDFLKFYEQAAKTARRYFPNAKIGITVTFDGLTGKRKDLVARLVAASDGVFMTYYPATPKLTMKDEAQIAQDMTALLTAYPNKEIYFQELGYPSSEKVGSSEAEQAAYFKKMLPQINAHPNIAYANIFLLHDLSPAVCKALLSFYKLSGSDYGAFLCSLGLFDTEGKPKESWSAIQEALKPQATPIAPAPEAPLPTKKR